jgi:hypothetical protein
LQAGGLVAAEAGEAVTGAYLRVKRGGCFQNIEVEHLTDAERMELLGGRTPDALMKWLNMVCIKLADIERECFTREIQ